MLELKRISIVYRDAPQGCKRCSYCKQFKHLDDFESDRSGKDGHSWYCKDCRRTLRSTPGYMAKMRESGRKYRQKTRLKALQMIAKSEIPTCASCGCDFLPILEVNHKDGQGSKEYREIGGAIGLYRAIVTGKRGTDDLEVLCEICNKFHYIKMRYGGDMPFQIQWSKPLLIEAKGRRA